MFLGGWIDCCGTGIMHVWGCKQARAAGWGREFNFVLMMRYDEQNGASHVKGARTARWQPRAFWYVDKLLSISLFSPPN